MLVLSRKLGEKISIDGTVEFTILGIGRSRVTVGVGAPVTMRIARLKSDDTPDNRGGRDAAAFAAADEPQQFRPAPNVSVRRRRLKSLAPA